MYPFQRLKLFKKRALFLNEKASFLMKMVIYINNQKSFKRILEPNTMSGCIVMLPAKIIRTK